VDVTKERAALLSQIHELEAQVKKLTEIAGRAQADLQNAKTRLERDAENFRAFAAGAVLQKLLPVIDHFQRASQHLPADLAGNEWVKGVAAIEQDLMKRLADMGLRKMETIGKQVDPERHEVLMQGPGELGAIIEVFEDGYELGGKVLRPAKVKVGLGNVDATVPAVSDQK
jgi:molecular chaperone GrpE